jgi:chromosome segregation ATPase
MTGKQTIHVRSWNGWCAKWRDPAVLLAAAGALAAVGMWGMGIAMDEAQLINRVISLEKRADEQAATLSRFQEQVGQKIENLDGKVNQFALQLATLSPRLDGMVELLKTIKDNETATDQRIIEANRARDETARLRDAEWSRRFDSLAATLHADRR